MTSRKVTYSTTFIDQLLAFTDSGEQEYGERVAQEKKNRVFDFFDITIAATPHIKRRHPKLGLVVYPVSKTPFIVIYDYDDHEVQVFACLKKGAGTRLTDFDIESVEWRSMTEPV